MNVAACLIVKDDSEYNSLVKAINSIKPYIKDIFITSTSTPVDKIKTIEGVKHSSFKWNDSFADARNFNFSQVPEGYDYIFWMDADDLLVGGEYLLKIAEKAKNQNYDVIFFEYWYGCTFKGEPSEDSLVKVDIQHNRERLIRPGTNVWKGRLHETPVPVAGAKMKYTIVPYNKDQPIAIIHTASADNAIEKMERNKRLLKMQLKDEGDNPDPRTMLYLMKIYAEQDDKEQWKECIKMGFDYLKKSGWNEERAEAYELMAQCMGHAGEFAEAVSLLHKAIAEWPHQPILYVRLAAAYYNLKEYKKCKHWIDIASQMDLDNNGAKINNYEGLKIMFAEIMYRYFYNVEKNPSKALEAAKMLFKEKPTEENQALIDVLTSVVRADEACRSVDTLVRYMDDIGDDEHIPDIINALPMAIAGQPFGVKLRQKYTHPRTWKDNEICYYASLGGHHFEKWDGRSLKKGIGGSETAVIQLSEEWVKKGYKVTVYCDPEKPIEVNGVWYLPYFYFNPFDYFNIFIQWRNWNLTDKIKAKKIFVDLHDIYHPIDIKKSHIQAIDAFMVKSKYHRNLAKYISDSKFMIISNGIL
jgi:tetratricopeptide (TPR) repeat protein